METIEHFSDFLRRVGVPNFLVIGIVVIVLWLLVSGIRKGFEKRKKDRNSKDGGSGGEE